MKVMLLAGGFGTRLSEYTESVPKPMVRIGGKPILWHIMQRYAYYGHKDFYLALGYKSEIVKEYFLNYRALNSNFTVRLDSGDIEPHQVDPVDWRVTLVDTGLDVMTGGRVKRLQSYIGNEAFMLTYGDGVANIDLDALLAFHKSHRKMVTVTAVHPVARFGELSIVDGLVNSFREKPQMYQGWINGGYFIINPSFFEFIQDDRTVLEGGPLESVAKLGELMAYKHNGFWQCMDTKRDHDFLEDQWLKGLSPWKI